MKVLVACEESQAVCKAFRERGHEAYSCDIIPCSGGHPEWHIQQDVLPLINGDCAFRTTDGAEHAVVGKWDLLIAHPPCTHLAVSGARYFEQKRKDGRQQQGVEFFMRFTYADCPRVAIENPVGIMSTLYRKPDQIIQPWQFGHPTRKTTCLWLKGLPLLNPTEVVTPELKSFKKRDGSLATFGVGFDASINESGKAISWNDPRTARLRSKTFPGIARAMAEQWS